MTSPNQLRDELIRQNGPARPIELERLLRRDRWRVRVWAATCVVVWTAAAVYLLVLLGTYVWKIHPVINEFFTSDFTKPESAGVMAPRMMVITRLLVAALYWPALLLVAAVCTVLFTLASRRATLRQIQAGLATISDQLKALAAERTAPREQ